ncbi:MAG: hypothetical protein DWH78_04340 [Planctomycetota bacterium]|nr:MAG: hypothetical protein DWH78_04340 [Planctomycetota bacterium]
MAKAISGTHCNGFRFFRLEKEPRPPEAPSRTR